MSFKNRAALVVFAALLVLIIAPIHAQQGTTWFGDSSDGQWLVGIRVGSVANGDNGYNRADHNTIVLGYQFPTEAGVSGTTSLELEFGESDSGTIDEAVTGSNWETSTIGLFVNYRTTGALYFKTKLGILKSEVDSQFGIGTAAVNRTDTSFAYGAGLGIILGESQNINLELDWTGTSGDNNINIINLGGHVRF